MSLAVVADVKPNGSAPARSNEVAVFKKSFAVLNAAVSSSLVLHLLFIPSPAGIDLLVQIHTLAEDGEGLIERDECMLGCFR